MNSAAIKRWLETPAQFAHENTKKIRTLEYIEELEAQAPQWISVEERLPSDFVSVLAHMTDAGDFPAVREAYLVGKAFFFPALADVHPVDRWMEMPKEE